jgi:ankyrin repeat protein
VLLERGADIDARAGESGASPLHTACSNGAARTAAVLLAAGAVPTALDYEGSAPLACAATAAAADDVYSSSSDDAADSAAAAAVQAAVNASVAAAAASCVEMLCEAGANVNAAGAGGSTGALLSTSTLYSFAC